MKLSNMKKSFAEVSNMTTFEGHEGSKKKTKVKCQAGRQCCSRERSVGQKQTLVMCILV